MPEVQNQPMTPRRRVPGGWLGRLVSHDGSMGGKVEGFFL